MADLTLTVGGVDFQHFEIPEELRGGGDQIIAWHKYSGGLRKADTFGPDDAPLEWSGTFLDETAESRCQQIDAMRVAGSPVPVSWSSFNFVCIIRSFRWVYRRFYQIDYSITLEVVTNGNQPNTDLSDNPESDIQADFDDAAGFSGNIDDTGLSGLMQTLSNDVSSVPSITGAGSTFLGTLGGDVNATVSYVEGLATSADSALNALPSIPGGSSASLVASTLTQAAQQSDLMANSFAMGNTLGRLSDEIDSIF
jgi:hypothetical protein